MTQTRSSDVSSNLRQLDSAKEQWALENKKKPGDVPTAEDLKEYLKSFPLFCPATGKSEDYIIGPVGENPRCKNAKTLGQGHVLL